MLKRIHTYDLDGVLVDTSHRYRNLKNGSIDLDYWYANRHRLGDDKLLPLVKQYRADILNSEIYVIICTSRCTHVNDHAFIRDTLGQPNKLIMRPRGNMENDGPLKRRQLQRLFNLKQFQNLPRRFWDDNPLNLNACRDLFTEVFHVPSHITGNV
jgi:hypothetical protein